MKLSSVLLLIIFSSILFVRAVSDISAAAAVDGPYTIEASAYRVNTANVKLYASARCEEVRTKNGKFTFILQRDEDLDKQIENWQQFEIYNQENSHGTKFIDGSFYVKYKKNFPSTEYGYKVKSIVSGEATDGTRYGTSVDDKVGEIPILEPIPNFTATLAHATGSDYFATAGDTHEAVLTTNRSYYDVMWYVKAPGDTSEKGTNVETDSGNTLLTEVTLSYTFPDGVAGEYIITAVVREAADASTQELNYNVSVTLPPGLYRTTPYSFSLYGLGETLDFLVIADSPYNEVNWYLKKKDTTGLGTWLYANSGSDAETEGTFSYTFSSENGIEPYTDYILTARVERNSDNTNYNLTYEVNIGP